MKTMVILGTVIALTGCSKQEAQEQDHYEIAVSGADTAYKLNKQTGEVWWLHRNSCSIVTTNHLLTTEELLRGLPLQTNAP